MAPPTRTRARRSASDAPDREPITASLAATRRLAVVKQRLGGARPPHASKESILSVVRDLAYVQWDPVPIVAPSHVLSFWARVGDFRLPDLDDLLWKERRLWQHWIPFSALVLTEDFPIYGSLMRRYPDSLSDSWGWQREEARKFLREHIGLRRKILRELREGPMTLGQFEDHARTLRDEGDWGPSSDVSLLLYHLLMSGEVMIVGHDGAQNVWGLLESFLPGWADRHALSEKDAESAMAERAILALGAATPRDIRLHYIRGCYLDLSGTLDRLCERSVIHRVVIDGVTRRPEERYVHDRDVSLLESLTSGLSEPRVSLLPPFDNLVYNQMRLNRLFGFDYVREQFLPREKRRYGTYVLPILWGDQLVGRLDPRLDRVKAQLVVNSVHAEPSAPTDRAVGRAIADKIADLAEFLGAKEVVYTSNVPAIWKGTLR